ncbi:MAG: pilus assembly protein [Phycisphaerales bacterium]|nr:pilus assembly protein [Phycisphaerales bacterium]
MKRGITYSRRGNALLVTIILMPALIALIGLGVDYGRVRVTHSQLQDAVDAAARYASTGLHDGSAVSRAIAVASQNLVDGSPLVLLNSDVEVGTWNATTRAFTPGGASPNAVRVTGRRILSRGTAVPLVFSSVIGASWCDVQASAVALFVPSEGAEGFVGLNGVDLGNNAFADSYNSALGAPGGTNRGGNAVLGSNTVLDFGNNVSIHGRIEKGPSATINHGNHFQVTGGQVTRSSNFSYDPTETPFVASSGALVRANNQTVNLAAGTYHYSSITFGNNGRIIASGAVTIYVSGDVTVGNNFRIEADSLEPADVRLRFVGSGRKLDAGNNFRAIAQIYGPGVDIEVRNNAEFRGSIVARRIEARNNVDLWMDTGAGGGAVGSVALVN